MTIAVSTELSPDASGAYLELDHKQNQMFENDLGKVMAEAHGN